MLNSKIAAFLLFASYATLALSIVSSLNVAFVAFGFSTKSYGTAPIYTPLDWIYNHFGKYEMFDAEPIHQDEITKIALQFLKSDVLDKINTGHEFSDLIQANQDDPRYHFDSCTFDGSVLHINSVYKNILLLLKTKDPSKLLDNVPGDKMGAYEQFGEILHTIQDFYSHTNWVELRKANYIHSDNTLVDSGLGYWKMLKSDDRIVGTDVIVVEGKNPDPKLLRPNNGHLVLVTSGPSQGLGGLISGVADSLSNPNSFGSCPPNIALGHWDPYFLYDDGIQNPYAHPVRVNSGTEKYGILVPIHPSTPPAKGHYTDFKKRHTPEPFHRQDIEKGLNKDNSDRDNFLEAKNFALNQTTHEWCRLVNLVKTLDQPVLTSQFFNKWVDPDKKSEALSVCDYKIPIANAGPDQSVYSGNPVSLDGSGSQLPGSSTVGYTWRCDCSVQLINENSANPKFIAPYVNTPTNIAFTLVVTDGLASSSPDTVNINVAPVGGDLSTGQTLVVNTNDDVDDGNCNDVHCSLREAITASNDIPGRNLITFSIPGSTTIVPLTELPPITQTVTISGTSQPGASAQNPIVELNGNNIRKNGLTITGGNSIVEGLVINRFLNAGIKLEGNGGDLIQASFIGTDVTGKFALGNGPIDGCPDTSGVKQCQGAGILIINSPNNEIGGLESDKRNLISGNNLGIVITGATANGNVIRGNYIGTDVTGKSNLGNVGYGILISSGGGAYRNVVGGSEGTSPTVACTGACNLISGNQRIGIQLFQGGYNIIQGNFVGIDVTGKSPVPNGRTGVSIADSSLNTIGGEKANERNLISGNIGDGINIDGSGEQTTGGNLLQGNFVGTNLQGIAPVPNLGTGIIILNSSSNTIGGDKNDMTRTSCISTCNLVSRNGVAGVVISGIDDGSTTVQGNYIGVTVSGSQKLPNKLAGIALISGTNHNTIGGDTVEKSNVISGNDGHGIVLTQNSHHNLIEGNYVGTNLDGLNSIGNSGNGIAIKDSSYNVIRGDNLLLPHVISYNGLNGVAIKGKVAINNVIVNNEIHDNENLAIDLGDDGVTPNGIIAPTSESNANNYMVFPAGKSYYDSPNIRTFIKGSLQISDPPSSVIDLYANRQVDPSGFGEAEKWLGEIVPDASGDFAVSIPQHLLSLYPAVTATATDKTGSTSELSESFSKIIPPIANAGRTKNVTRGDTVILDGRNSTDPDGTIIAYTWQQIGGPTPVTLNSTNSAVVQFVAPREFVKATYTFRLTVEDNDNAIDVDEVQVNVNDILVALDDDQDGILNLVDLKPMMYSNNFSDAFSGGYTGGEIVNRSGLILIVDDAIDALDGVAVTADASSKPFPDDLDPAMVKACNGTVKSLLRLGDEFTITCIVPKVNVESGSIFVEYNSEGRTVNASLLAGNKLIFNPANTTVSAAISNKYTIDLLTSTGIQISLAPGESRQIFNDNR